MILWYFNYWCQCRYNYEQSQIVILIDYATRPCLLSVELKINKWFVKIVIVLQENHALMIEMRSQQRQLADSRNNVASQKDELSNVTSQLLAAQTVRRPIIQQTYMCAESYI